MKRQERTRGYEVLKDTDIIREEVICGQLHRTPDRYISVEELASKLDESLEILNGLVCNLKLMGRWNESSDTVSQYDFANAITQVATSIEEQVRDIGELWCEITMAKHFVKDGETIDDILFIEKIKGLVKEHLAKSKEGKDNG